jgi:glutamate--cysteine ligase
VLEAGQPIALVHESEASITLEPGGQLELSGAPLRTIHETCDEFHRHLALLERTNAGVRHRLARSRHQPALRRRRRARDAEVALPDHARVSCRATDRSRSK